MAHNPYPDFAWTVDFDPEVPCVAMTWQGYATSRAFREANEQIEGKQQCGGRQGYWRYIGNCASR